MIRPLHDHVVVSVLDGEERVSSGGIVYSQGCEKTHKRGRVLRVGPGRRHRSARGTWRTEASAMPVEVGDLVLFQDWRTVWHSGDGEWPDVGDEALVPIDALELTLGDEDMARTIDVTRLGRSG